MAAYTNAEIASKHLCSPYGGIRKSNRKKCIVLIISDDSVYTDTIKGNGHTIDYVGQGKTGDQTLTRNNKALAETTWPVYVYHKVTDTHVYKYMGEYMVYDYTYARQSGRRVVMFTLDKVYRDITPMWVNLLILMCLVYSFFRLFVPSINWYYYYVSE